MVTFVSANCLQNFQCLRTFPKRISEILEGQVGVLCLMDDIIMVTVERSTTNVYKPPYNALSQLVSP